MTDGTNSTLFLLFPFTQAYCKWIVSLSYTRSDKDELNIYPNGRGIKAG